LGFTQHLSEISTRNEKKKKKFLGSRALPARKADNLTTLTPSVSRSSRQSGISTSHNPIGLHGRYGNGFFTLPTHIRAKLDPPPTHTKKKRQKKQGGKIGEREGPRILHLKQERNLYGFLAPEFEKLKKRVELFY
jgi:hypothetical protein